MPQKLQFDNLRDGVLLMIWGYFLKVVIADRATIFVDTVYNLENGFDGWFLIVGTILFGIQLYCDFGGCTTIAMGAARMLGIDLIDNFQAPYLSRSNAEFWRRWHISLSTWFRDYLYIPLGGSRKGRRRKYLNLLIVFAVSGLWHGAALSFVVWGLLNGLYQVVGGVTQRSRTRLRRRLGLADDAPLTALLQVGITFLLSSAAWVFFKAGSFTHALDIFRAMVTGPWLTRPLSAWGLDRAEVVVAAVALILLLGVDLYTAFRGSPREKFCALPRPIRWVLALGLLAAVLLFGIYGTGYDPQDFIYFKF